MTEITIAVPSEMIESRIILIRNMRVMLDTDLAELYGVETKVLNQAVKRNLNRFPPDFMFKLMETEKHEVVTNCDHLSKLKFSSVLPNAFTEHGAIMVASVLNSERAIATSVFVVRAFVKMREMITATKELEVRFLDLERRIDSHDDKIKTLLMAIKQLMAPPDQAQKIKMGFHDAKQ